MGGDDPYGGIDLINETPEKKDILEEEQL